MTRRVQFLGGPYDGDERVFGSALVTELPLKGAVFEWKKDGEVTGRGQKVYLYRLLIVNGKYVYRYEREVLQTLEGGEPDVIAEARDGAADPAGPEPEPEQGNVGGVE